MKILIITQKVDRNDPILGFFHRWIIEFVKHFELVTVICLEKGEHNLPKNVRVLSLGKEKKRSRFLYLTHFYKYIWQERKNYDVVFVHMNPVYVVLGGLFWKLSGKKITLWYTHKSVDLKLKMAEKIVDKIFTASVESFRLRSRKVHIVGHGICIDDFVCKSRKINSDFVNILSVGRITKIKNCDTLILAAKILRDRWSKNFKISFVGSPLTRHDTSYLKELNDLVMSLGLSDRVFFINSIPAGQICQFYCQADLTVNLSPSGGSDKVVLESLAAKTPIIVSNEAFLELLGDYSDNLMAEERNSDDLAKKIMSFFEIENKSNMADYLYSRVEKKYKLENFIDNIVKLIK